MSFCGDQNSGDKCHDETRLRPPRNSVTGSLITPNPALQIRKLRANNKDEHDARITAGHASSNPSGWAQGDQITRAEFGCRGGFGQERNSAGPARDPGDDGDCQEPLISSERSGGPVILGHCRRDEQISFFLQPTAGPMVQCLGDPMTRVGQVLQLDPITNVGAGRSVALYRGSRQLCPSTTLPQTLVRRNETLRARTAGVLGGVVEVSLSSSTDSDAGDDRVRRKAGSLASWVCC